jgi:zinc transporter 1/2/3
MATAFVHLLPTAFTSLTDPCLAWFWSVGYKPMAGVIAMSSALIVVAIEMFLRTKGAGHSHSHNEPWDPVSTEDEDHDHRMHGANGPPRSIPLRKHGRPAGDHRPNDIRLGDIDESEGMLDGASPLPTSTPIGDRNGNGNKHMKFQDQDDFDDGDSDLDLDELDPVIAPNNDVETNNNSQPLDPKEEQRRLLIQCLLLEAGILFHSVFIGMAVSVATGPAFVVFLVAISCHQTFEGLALGTRIAAISFPKSSPRPWLMVLAYGTTTPVGQAIGLIVHRMYDPLSEAGLLMVGIMNAISSGLLLYAGLVQLLAEDFLTDKSYETLTGRKRWRAFSAVIGGATLMALVGAWA